MKKIIYTILSITMLTACKKETTQVNNTSNTPTYTSNIDFSSIGNPIGKFGNGVTDIDGNKYKTVIIGNQEWMAENMKVSKYNDGTTIPNITDSLQWFDVKSGAWCNYKNLDSNGVNYGKLYNWYVISTQKICPTGWHVPTQKDWQKLTQTLGSDSLLALGELQYGDSIISSKLREIKFRHWFLKYNSFANSDANNISLFTALPAGGRFDNKFEGMNHVTVWWTSTIDNGFIAPPIINIEGEGLFFDPEPLNSYKNAGFSLRCIKD
jgi:uncharacterized protein (TIGR02145 family)